MSRLLKLTDRGADVVDLQRQLRCVGQDAVGAGEGVFDARTAEAVHAFQLAQSLPSDGIVGPLTLAALNAAVAALTVPELHDYRGAWGFLLHEEGHRGRPYWPRGQSGLTLDPGFDLGYHRFGRLVSVYGRILSALQLERLRPAIGVRGADAERFVDDPRIRDLQILREAAGLVLPQIACRYWQEAAVVCPALVRASTPAGVHTALLSLAYNAGPDDLEALRTPSDHGDWRRVAQVLAAKHAGQPAIAARRHREAGLILSALATR